MALIDEFLPRYDDSEIHSLVIQNTTEDAYTCVRNFTFSNTVITTVLFTLRGLSSQKVSLKKILDSGFIFLGEKENDEFVIGLIGKFWTPSGSLQRMNPEEFIYFDKPGFAKAAWNFSFEKVNDTQTKVSTKTRILCLDKSSRWKFKLYWALIRPFSGLIRMEILKSIAKEAEKTKHK